MGCIHIVTETTVAIEKKSPFALLLPYLSSIYLQKISVIYPYTSYTLNCCKLSVAFKNKTRLGNAFQFKGCIPNDLTTGVS